MLVLLKAREPDRARPSPDASPSRAFSGGCPAASDVHPRYFVLVDGLWDTEAWKLISSALPDKNHGSRVLTTTHSINVAKSCCMHPSDSVYHMKPLSEEYSRSLFVRSIPERDQRPAEFDEVSAKYVSMSDGMPLALIIAAGYLDSKSSELAEAKMLWKSTEQYFSTLEGKTTIQSILQMSYDDLALPVRSCFLYLSVFPEDYTIKKDRLIRLWLAEEFIPQERRSDEESLWQTGERYFNELISRRLIQFSQCSTTMMTRQWVAPFMVWSLISSDLWQARRTLLQWVQIWVPGYFHIAPIQFVDSCWTAMVTKTKLTPWPQSHNTYLACDPSQSSGMPNGQRHS